MEEMNVNEVMPETQATPEVQPATEAKPEPTGIEALKVTEWMRDNLLRSMNWMMFFAVIGCAGMVLLLIVALVMLAAGAFVDIEDGGIMLGLGLFYLIMVAVYVYPLMKSFAYLYIMCRECPRMFSVLFTTTIL